MKTKTHKKHLFGLCLGASALNPTRLLSADINHIGDTQQESIWTSWEAVLLYILCGVLLVLVCYYRAGIRRLLRQRQTAEETPSISPPALLPARDTSQTFTSVSMNVPEIHSTEEQFVQRAIDCVTSHLTDDKFDQQIFASEMGISKSSLYKKLITHTGLNTTTFIRKVRLEASCRILQDKGERIRISELAYAVGFSDPKYFSICFRKEYGVSPKKYALQTISTEEEGK